MKKTTIDGKVVDTDKLGDIESEMIEILEKSPIKKFCDDRKCQFFLWGRAPNTAGYASFGLKNGEDMIYLVRAMDEIMQSMSKGKYRIGILDVSGEENDKGDTWKKPE